MIMNTPEYWTKTSLQRHLKFDVFEQACSAKLDMFEEFKIPFSSVSTAWSSCGRADSEDSMDLNQLCIKHPQATYYIRASGESMQDAGIHDGDVLVVDRSLKAVNGNIVVAALNGDLTVKILSTDPHLCLEPRNSAYSIVNIGDEDDFEIFGVVTYVIHSTLG